MTVRYIGGEDMPPIAVSGEQDGVTKANAAHGRAMPINRMIDYGMSYEDSFRLHGLANQCVPWLIAAEWLGDQHLVLARQALASGHVDSAREHLLHGCACFRFGQSAVIQDTDERRRLYRKVIDAFADAAALMSPAPQKIAIPVTGGTLSAWLLCPPEAARSPVVIVFGGADGWRESYFPMAKFLLERRIAVCLLDGPGQGESRLFNGVFLDEEYPQAFSSVITHLLARKELGKGIGVLGNSLGGTLAAGVAAHDERVAAVCVNGGSSRPIEVLDRFPRFIDRFAAMTAGAKPAAARLLLEGLALDGVLPRLHSPLLVLHGGADRIFLIETARRIYDRAESNDRRMEIWHDGEHCLYNHALERNCLLADWFSERLI